MTVNKTTAPSKSNRPAKRPVKKAAWGQAEKKKYAARCDRELALIAKEIARRERFITTVSDAIADLQFQRTLIGACRLMALQN